MFMCCAYVRFSSQYLYHLVSQSDGRHHSVSVLSCLGAIRAELDGDEHTVLRSALQVEAQLR